VKLQQREYDVIAYFAKVAPNGERLAINRSDHPHCHEAMRALGMSRHNLATRISTLYRKGLLFRHAWGIWRLANAPVDLSSFEIAKPLPMIRFRWTGHVPQGPKKSPKANVPEHVKRQLVAYAGKERRA
jgi:biotin operon repressor